MKPMIHATQVQRVLQPSNEEDFKSFLLNYYVELPKAVKTRYIKFEHVYVPTPNLAISNIRIFGNGYGKSPKTPAVLKATRQADTRNATITWKPVLGL